MNMWEYNIIHYLQRIVIIALDETKKGNSKDKKEICEQINYMYNEIIDTFIEKLEKANNNNNYRITNLNKMKEELKEELKGL